MQLRLERLEDRTAPAAFSGAVWPTTTLTYNAQALYDGVFGQTLSPREVHTSIREAFSLWAQAAPLNFVEVTGPADITLTYANDGGDPAFAHADFPGAGCTITFDVKPAWQNEPIVGTNLLYVATHEIGHALGLAHEDDVPAIMTTFYQSIFGGPGSGFLQADDITGIQTLYGVGAGSVSPLPPPANFSDLLLVPERGGLVAVFGDGEFLDRFYPFAGYEGPISVSTADVNGDGQADIRVVANNGHYRSFDAFTGAALESQMLLAGYVPQPGVEVSLGELGGTACVILSGNGRVQAISLSSGQTVYDDSPFIGYQGSISAATTSGRLVLLAKNHVKVIEGRAERDSFFAFAYYDGAVRLSLGLLDGQEVALATAIRHVKAFAENDLVLSAIFGNLLEA